jgi:uncharacterized protein (TIGR02413 family)
MTLNIFFLTITIKKRTISSEELIHQEMTNKIYEENKDRQYSLYKPY